uniref:Class I SAM-dependent methyltransferase n=1 Tax=Ignavibacterium album TaxID=591197 RepID=A0A832G6Q9_9BACT
MRNNNTRNKTSERIIELSEHFSKRSNYWEEIYSKSKNPPNFMIYELDSRKEKALFAIDRFANGRTINVLDIGCGTGHYMEELLIRNHNVTGIDVAFGMLMKAKQKLDKFNGKSHLIKSNIENLPFNDNSFDVILCIGVIEYLPDIPKALKEINRVLKGDGIVILSAPNLYSLRFLTDPYYLIRGFQFLLKKLGIDIKKRAQTNYDVSMNVDFKNKRFSLKTLTKTFKEEKFRVFNLSSVAYGPYTFFQTPYFNLSTNIKINNYLIRLSNKNKVRFLSYFANRWIFELNKTNK